MIDTHTHLYLAEYFPDGGASAVRDAVSTGVEMMILPAIDIESAEPLLSLHREFPGNTACAAGLHPTEVESNWTNELSEILESFAGTPLVAIGEIGVDLHWDKTNLSLQLDAFGHQLDLARCLGIPAIIHSRDAIDETLHIIKSFGSDMPNMVFHSFTYGPREAERVLELAEGAMFGFNGVITFKNAGEVREAARIAGIDRIVAETDSPFLSPVPHRGQTNCSAFLPDVVGGISRALSLPYEEAVKLTTSNARSLFKLPGKD